MPAHQQLGDAQRVVYGPFGMPQRLDEVVVQMIGLEPHDILIGADRLRHFDCDGRFVVVLVVEADGEGLDRRLLTGR